MHRLLYAAVALCLSGAVAYADPVTYTLTGTFSGSLGALTFTDTPGTISQVTDTSAIVLYPSQGVESSTGGTSTITLNGVGTATFLNSSFGANAGAGNSGFYDIDTLFSVSESNPQVATYDLSSSYSATGTLFLNPIFLSAPTAYYTEPTSLGVLDLTGDLSTSATFTAAVTSEKPAAVTPEPSSLVLLGTGLLGLAGATRRRFAVNR